LVATSRNARLCIGCRNHVKDSGNYHWCRRTILDVVTGDIIPLQLKRGCSDQRLSENSLDCGIDARFWDGIGT
jgi:hypothetical protein